MGLNTGPIHDADQCDTTWVLSWPRPFRDLIDFFESMVYLPTPGEEHLYRQAVRNNSTVEEILDPCWWPPSNKEGASGRGRWSDSGAAFCGGRCGRGAGAMLAAPAAVAEQGAGQALWLPCGFCPRRGSWRTCLAWRHQSCASRGDRVWDKGFCAVNKHQWVSTNINNYKQ